MNGQASDFFSEADVNADGGITRAEFKQALRNGTVAPGPNAISRPSVGSSGMPSASPGSRSVAAEAAPANEQRLPTIPEPGLITEESGFTVGDKVSVGGRQGTLRINLCPGHKFVKVCWDDSPNTVSDLIPASEVRLVEKVPAPIEFDEAIAEAERRIAKARDRYLSLTKEGDALKKENSQLKEVVVKARATAERYILKKRAENVQLLADNAELEKFTTKARHLAEQKATMQVSQDGSGNAEWETLQENSDAIRRRLDRALARPNRIGMGSVMDSPRSNISSLEATPRIEAVQEWRCTGDALPDLSPAMATTRTDAFQPAA